MDWPAALGFGAAGGVIVEIVNFWGNLAAWRQRRKRFLGEDRLPPSWRKFFDPVPDALAACTRLVLGGIAGLAFRDQVTSALAAITVGASAPALLRQLGTVRALRESVQHSAGVVEERVHE